MAEVEVEQGDAASRPGGGVSGLEVDGVQEGKIESGSPVRCSLGSAGSTTSSLARDIALVYAAEKESGGVDAGDGEGVSTGRVEGVEERKSVDLLEAYFTHMDKKYEQWIREAEGGGGEEEDEEYEDEEDEVEV